MCKSVRWAAVCFQSFVGRGAGRRGAVSANTQYAQASFCLIPCLLQVRLDTSLAAVDPGALIHQAPLVSANANSGSSRVAGTQPIPQHTAVVIFSYLKSWERMGKAQFR